jgi:hypothetical protein
LARSSDGVGVVHTHVDIEGHGKFFSHQGVGEIEQLRCIEVGLRHAFVQVDIKHLNLIDAVEIEFTVGQIGHLVQFIK